MKLLDLQDDPLRFREALLIDTDAGPRSFVECMDEWQAADFNALDSGWKRAVVGTSAKATFQRGWLERPRGHSKSADLGVMAAWALFASRRRLSGIAAAGDQDQARLLRDAIGKLVYCNPWLGKLLEVQSNRVINTRTESTLEIITSDAPTSYGLTPDFVIADEVVHWRKRDLWDSLISSAAKRSTCMFVSITNAGLTDDWQWKIREVVRTDAKWHFARLDGPVASWIDKELLAEQERLLPGIAFRRLWLNEWTTGGGDALTEEILKVAFRPELRPQESAYGGYEYVGGLDLGVTRDASAVCILGVRRDRTNHGQIRLAFTKMWKPAKGKRVDLQEVEDTLVELHQQFTFKQLNYDPWEARHLASRLQASGLGKLVTGTNRRVALPMVEISQTGQNLQRIASTLLEAFNDGRVLLFNDPDLMRDLRRLRVEERQYGFRLTFPRDEHGHGDLGTAFALAMLAASELAAKRRAVVGAIGSHDADDGLSAFGRALQDFEQRAADYREEMLELYRAGNNHDGYEEWEQFMKVVGRL